jgi:hypothetical protein
MLPVKRLGAAIDEEGIEIVAAAAEEACPTICADQHLLTFIFDNLEAPKKKKKKKKATTGQGALSFEDDEVSHRQRGHGLHRASPLPRSHRHRRGSKSS